MPGIKDLREIYENQGLEEVEKYLNGNLIITEKLDAHRFSLEITPKREFVFFKKNHNTPLTIIDRTISDLYEKAIMHFDNLSKLVKNNIPVNTRFGFAYFPSNKPLRIEYKNLPKNCLVLTDITQRSETGKVKKVYENLEFLNRWACVLNVANPPIIFQGILSQSSKEILLNLIAGNSKAFFVENITNALNKTYSGNHIIEGIVIKSDYGLAQIKDPTFDLFETAYEPQESRDFYDLTIIQIKNFMENFDYPLHFQSKTPEEKYIEVICQAFNQYVDQHGINENLDPSFLQPKILGNHGQLSRKFIKNPRTIEYINRAKIYEELFKVFLSSLRKERKPHGLLTQSFVEDFNQIVRKISEITSNKFYSFEDYQKVFEANNSDVYDQGVKLKDKNFQANTFKVISSIQLAFDHRQQEIKRGETGVTVMLGKFDPLNRDHMREIQQLGKETKIFLCHISRRSTGLSHQIFQLDDDIITKMLAKIAQDHSNYIVGYATIAYASIAEIFRVIRKFNFEPLKLLVENGCGPNYLIQLYMEDKVLGKRLNAVENFEIQEFNNTKAYQILQSLQNENYTRFAENTPQEIHGFWDVILAKWKNWAGYLEFKTDI